MAQDRPLHRFGQAVRREDADTLRRMLIGRRVLRVGKPLVVEVVQQSDEAPVIGALAILLGERPHRQLHRVHVPAERLGLGVLVNEGERLVSGHWHGEKLPPRLRREGVRT